MGGHVFADLGGIDVDVDNLSPGGHLIGSGHRRSPTRAPGQDHQIGIADGLIGRDTAVGTQHAQVQRMGGGQSADAHHGADHRDAALLCKGL